MLARLRKVLQRRHSAIVEAEAGSTTSALRAWPWEAAANDPHQDAEHRCSWRLVARIAATRLDSVRIPDVATVCYVENEWMCRRGQKIC